MYVCMSTSSGIGAVVSGVSGIGGSTQDGQTAAGHGGGRYSRGRSRRPAKQCMYVCVTVKKCMYVCMYNVCDTMDKCLYVLNNCMYECM